MWCQTEMPKRDQRRLSVCGSCTFEALVMSTHWSLEGLPPSLQFHGDSTCSYYSDYFNGLYSLFLSIMSHI